MNGMLNNRIRTRADRILTNNVTITEATLIGTEPIEHNKNIHAHSAFAVVDSNRDQKEKQLQKPILPSDHERALLVCDFYFIKTTLAS